MFIIFVQLAHAPAHFVHPRKFVAQIRLGAREILPFRGIGEKLFHIQGPDMSRTFSAWIVGFMVFTVAVTTPLDRNTFNLRIIHTNDMHARFEQTSKLGGKCTENDIKLRSCYGGFPRLLTAVKEEKRKAQQENVPLLFLNAGDSYQGTSWYNVHKWRVVSALLNLLPIDAMSLGNHEFDDGVEGLVPFLNNSKIPVVTCNLGLEEEPELAKTPMKPSEVFEISGKKVGVIGYLTPETITLSQTGKVKIYDEIEAVRAEAQRMKDKGIDMIIAVGHSGFETDLKIAKKVPLVDVVVGGHTNTFLYTGTQPDLEVPANLYPVMVTQSTGRKVAVVQAYAYTKYLGILDLVFDEKGELLKATGNPALLHFEIAQDPEMLKAMEPWREAVQNMTGKNLGKTKVFLDGNCRFDECNLGNLVTDAYIHYGVQNHFGPGWATAPIAIQQAGGIRTSLNASRNDGTISMEDIMTIMPFSGTVEIMNIKGKYLLEALEWSVFRFDTNHIVGRGEFLQYSGMQVTYNLAKPPGYRVVEALARCGDCEIPKMSPIRHEHSYNLILPTFLARGGDNFTMFPKYGRSILTFVKMDTDIVADFIQERKLVYNDIQGRIKFAIPEFSTITNVARSVQHSIPLFLIVILPIFIFT